MAAVNSLLFLLSTLAPYTEPPDIYSTTPTDYPYWDTQTDNYEDNVLKPCPLELQSKEPINCSFNEHYERCGAVCQECCIKYKCPLNCCIEGCFCNEGYIRSLNNTCVKREKCFEALVVSGLHQIKEGDLEPCFPGMPQQEVPVCQPNEHYEECGNLCQETCSKHKCPVECCVPGCFCDEGYVRDVVGTCIKKEECSDSTDLHETNLIKGDGDMEPCVHMPPMKDVECYPNEHYEKCGAICQEACIKYECPMNCCVEGCFCNEGYVRYFNSSCVKKEECFPPPDLALSNEIKVSDSDFPHTEECGPDEYIGCESECQRNCSNYHDIISCPRACVLGCVCSLPKIRGPDGDCILPIECPNPLLAQIDKDRKDDMMLCHLMRVRFPQSKCPLRAEPCNNPDGCPDDDNYDILKYFVQVQKDEIPGEGEQCFPEIEDNTTYDCPPGEHFEDCGPICLPLCMEYNCSLKCCVPGCFCPEGYVRGGPGSDCIRKDECPANDRPILAQSDQSTDSITPPNKLCGPGESFRCESECERNCSNYQDEHPECPFKCRCVCDRPKIRGPDGDCILPEQCSLKTLEKDMTRAAVICNFLRIMQNPPAWSNTCPMIVKECSDPEGCSSEIKENSLPRPQEQFGKCRENEIWKLCPPSCPDTCENYQNEDRACKYVCLPIIIPKCDCKPGFVRGPTGDCITPEECPGYGNSSECTENEYYNHCGSACERNCTTVSVPVPPYACIDKSCVPGCFCKSGFIRGPDGKCISYFECYIRSPQPVDSIYGGRTKSKATPICPANEYYDDCGTSCPLNCANYDEDFPCPAACAEGCFCKLPLIRGPAGDCIKIDDCPQTRKLMEQSDDDSTKSKVTPVCPANEYYDDCGTYCPRNCTNYDKPIRCPTACAEGCFCKLPLIRGPDGDCIKIDDCPQTRKLMKQSDDDDKGFVDQSDPDRTWGVSGLLSCEENEVFTLCKSVCPDTCNNYKEERACRIICLPGCSCKKGYVISRNGDCVKKEDCVEDRPEDCSEFEEYNECGSYCEADCFDKYKKPESCNIKECRKGCYCKPGWVRSGNECIRPTECQCFTLDCWLQYRRDSSKEANYFRSRM